MKNWIAMGCAAVLFGCASREDLLEAEVQRQNECDQMREELIDAEGNPLIHATLQENYNRQCIDGYPEIP